MQFGEGIGADRGDKHADQRGGKIILERIPERAEQRDAHRVVRKDGYEAVKLEPHLRPPGKRGVVRLGKHLERRDDQHIEGNQDDERHKDERGISPERGTFCPGDRARLHLFRQFPAGIDKRRTQDGTARKERPVERPQIGRHDGKNEKEHCRNREKDVDIAQGAQCDRLPVVFFQCNLFRTHSAPTFSRVWKRSASQ